MNHFCRFDKAFRGVRWLQGAGALLLLGGTVQGVVAQAIPPNAAYTTFSTEHFRVTYAGGLEAMAERAAERAERAHALLSERFLPPPRGMIDLLLTDHSDLSNGFALVTPSNRIIIWASAPVEGIGIAHYDDWLELVVLHEVVHIFQLERAGGPAALLRRVFGRVPQRWPYFPGFTLPTLAIEGVAVHFESELTGGGRLHGPFPEAVVRAQALEGGVERVDQAMGRSPIWPGGDRPYLYGGLFFAHLAERFGSEAVGRFFDEVAGQWIPFRLNAAARRAFGVPFDALWEEWRDGVEEEARALAHALESEGGTAPVERLTRGARQALHAAPAPSGGGEIAYLRSDGRSDTRLLIREGGGSERTVALWNGISPPSWTPDGALVAPRLEFESPYHLRRDLYRVTREGRMERLTRGMRIVHASVDPVDGRIVAVAEGEGMNRLLLLAPDGTELRELRAAEPGVLWSFPRWSPDGSRIAVVRWRSGGTSGILVLDPAAASEPPTGDLVLVEDAAMHTAPVWSPGGEWVLWSSDRDGIPNLVAAPARGGALRQLTRVATAATYPAVDPEGSWVYFSLLGREGWDLARIPFDPDEWGAAAPMDPRYMVPHGRFAEGADPGIKGSPGPYSALPTLGPRYWLPTFLEAQEVSGVRVLPLAVGVESSGSDLVERHRWGAAARVGVGEGVRSEGVANYSWAGLGNPVLHLDGAQRYQAGARILAGGGETPPDSLFPRFRERSLGASLELRRQRVRSVGALTLGMHGTRQRMELLESDLSVTNRYRAVRPARSLAEARVGVLLTSARAFPFSVSPERGAAFAALYRERWDLNVPDSLAGVRGSDGRLRDVIGVVRGFQAVSGPGFANHVAAVRLAAGRAAGPGAGDGHFPIGGGGGGGSGAGGFTFDEAAGSFPVRGFARGAGSGVEAWGGSAEWRFPLRLLHRGFGAWPLHLDRLSGAVFLEGAGARRRGGEWTRLGSAGAEMVLGHSRFFEAPVLLRAGVAVPFHGGQGVSVYAGYGLSF